MSRYEQDDKGVMCYYDAENEEWLTAECSCNSCGYRDVECVCDEDEQDWRNPEYDITCNLCGDCRYGHDDEGGWVLRNERWVCGVCVNDPVEVEE
jgi:hypothetical protein